MKQVMASKRHLQPSGKKQNKNMRSLNKNKLNNVNYLNKTLTWLGYNCF